LRQRPTPRNVSGILDAISKAGRGERLTVADLVDALGSRSFGPLLLAPSLVLISPLSAIPGAPTMGAIAIVLVSGQVLIGRRTLWLPAFLRRRSIARSRIRTVARRMQPVAAVVDRYTGRRLAFLVRSPLDRLLLVPCIVLALAMPLLELVPMSSTILASAIFLLALALTVRDGVLALLALVVTAAVPVAGLMLIA
jgi:hypothetical protein